MRLRYESFVEGESITATIRREPDGTAGGAISLSGAPMDSSSGAPVLYEAVSGGSYEAGTYAVDFYRGGVRVETRYAVLLEDEASNPDADASLESETRHRGALYREIVLAVRQRLVDAGVWSDTQAYIALADDIEPHPTEGYTFGRVCPMAVMGGPWQDGGGRCATGANAPILVRAYVRRITDRAGIAHRALALPGGLMEITDRVTEALVQFMPRSASSDILCEPLQLAAHDRPVRFSQDEAWYRAEVQLSTTYAARFKDTDPA